MVGNVTELALKLGESNRHLAERAYQDKLSEALSAALGATVRLRVEFGVAGESSIAANDRRARQALLDKATASFNDDPFVREAVKLFDARVRPQTIQPVQPTQSNTSQQGSKS
jgi:DNA polymerase-3 subunit gamma/tau